MNRQGSKKERARLRTLAAQAHENELNDAVTELFEKFTGWADKQMDVFELNHEIHKFHDGVSRDLYKLYVLNRPELAVAVGIARGAIKENDVGEKIMERLGPTAEAIKSNWESE